MNRLEQLLVTLGLCLGAAGVAAQVPSSPVGSWKTIDDDGKTERSLIRISESGGVFSGRIEKIFDPALQNARCTLCLGDQRGAPVLGMEVLRQLRADPADAGTWGGGLLVDPSTGRAFRARLKLLAEGKQLEARGSLGPISRAQTWVRVE